MCVVLHDLARGSSFQVESLYNDIDFRSRLSRQALEDALASTQSQYALPIPAALSRAGINIDDLTSVILFGGNTRVPFVQSAIKTILGDVHADKIAQNVNTDEAAVLGAAYYGAGLSRQFKMKSLDVLERSQEAFTLNGEVFFPQSSGLGEKKAITLPAKQTELAFAQGA
jgi:hypoxia up-regulated 1